MLDDALERDLDEKKALGIFSLDTLTLRLFLSLSFPLGLFSLFSGSVLPFEASSSPAAADGDVVGS